MYRNIICVLYLCYRLLQLFQNEYVWDLRVLPVTVISSNLMFIVLRDQYITHFTCRNVYTYLQDNQPDKSYRCVTQNTDDISNAPSI